MHPGALAAKDPDKPANVYPQEVENGLTLHPAVYDVAVIGVPDADMGEVVKAVVVPAEGAQPGPELKLVKRRLQERYR